jgi:hypothetical protein
MDKKKFFVELNGVANIKILTDEIREDAKKNNNEHVLNLTEKIDQQLDILERYILAVADSARKDKLPPYWHEVRENKQNYPLNKDRRY